MAWSSATFFVDPGVEVYEGMIAAGPTTTATSAQRRAREEADQHARGRTDEKLQDAAPERESLSARSSSSRTHWSR